MKIERNGIILKLTSYERSILEKARDILYNISEQMSIGEEIDIVKGSEICNSSEDIDILLKHSVLDD